MGGTTRTNTADHAPFDDAARYGSGCLSHEHY